MWGETWGSIFSAFSFFSSYFFSMVNCGKLATSSFSPTFIFTTLVSYLVLPIFLFKYLFVCLSEVLVRDGMR